MIRIYLTGRMAIEAGRVVDESSLPGSQGRVLLAVLAMARAPVSRLDIANILWDREPPVNVERSLNPLISKLRAAMVDAGTSRDQVVVSSGTVELRRGAHLWVDVDEAIRALDRAEGLLRRNDYRQAWSQAAVATSILGRGFLEGVDSWWADERRQALREMSVRAHEVVSDVWLGLGDATQAVVAAQQLVAVDRFRETSYTKLIRAHVSAGNRAQALRVFADCEVLLRRELGVEPSPAVQAAYEQALESG